MNQPKPDSRARLLELFKSRAVFFGQFTLASGKQSPYYINSKKAIFNAETVWLLGDVLYQMTRDLNIQAIGGPEVGAIPMACAAAMRYHEQGQSIEAFYVRKQAKSHGTREMVEGVVRPGDRVAVARCGERGPVAALPRTELGHRPSAVRLLRLGGAVEDRLALDRREQSG